jgi:dolichol-phosphate mannosyltransferase
VSTPDLSIVIPIYNEEEGLPELDRRLREALAPTGLDYEILFVNDGSQDGSLALLRKLRDGDPRIKLIDFSRNFGHQLAISAGIDHAGGRAVIVMDGDLQDPPEVLPGLVERWREGYEVVYAVRKQRKEGAAKRVAYAAFYRLLQRLSDTEIPLDSGDFSLLDRRVVDMLVSLPERNRFVRGLRAWVGFRQTSYEYEREARFAGEPKYDLRRLSGLALDGILAFSRAPLRLATILGLSISGIGAVLATWTLIKRLVGYEVVPGFATLAILVLFFGGVQLVTIGILGEYIARIYTEVKARPRYVIRELEGVEPSSERHGLPPEG